MLPQTIEISKITSEADYQELLARVIGQLQFVIAAENGKRIHKERKQAEAGVYEDLGDQLLKMSRFPGVVMDQTGETVDQRLQIRHKRAMQARDFLNLYDHFANNDRGEPPASLIDPRLVRFIAMAVKAQAAYEAARPDIMKYLIVPKATAETPSDKMSPTAIDAGSEE